MFAHSFPFDPAYGYDRERLLTVNAAPEPAGFAAFWRQKYAEARAEACEPQMTLSPRQSVRGFQVYEVSFRSLGGQRIGGWISLPRDRPITRGLVISHGYDGRTGPDAEVPAADAAAIYPCARGLGASADPAIPADPLQHVLQGIESRDTYVHLGCAADVWAAATALIELVPASAARLAYLGASFGGGIGALALPWDDRFRRAYLAVPSFGNHPLRLELPCIGSGEAVRQYAQIHPEVRSVLAYFDASVAARHVRIPTLVAAALFDPAVPPPGQFAVHQGLAGPKALLTLPAAHFAYAGEAEDNQRAWSATVRWLDEADRSIP